LWDQTQDAFAQRRTWQRGRNLALGALVGLGRHTVSGLITATGQQFADWSAHYRLFAHERFDPQALLAPARRAVVERLAPEAPLVVLMDDTLLRKRGRKIAGTGWRRDPLGPPFAGNIIWAQRFLQLSAALPESAGGKGARARAIPIDLVHCPSPRKPSKRASPEQWEQYRQARAITKISRRGVERVAALRAALDQDGQHHRPLIVAADGAFTNRTVLTPWPEGATLVGRLRKDAKLEAPPPPEGELRRGRKRCYGTILPTPEHIRQDETVPWQQVPAFAAGRHFDFDVKVVGPVRWRAAGPRDLRLLIIRPLGYRLTQNGRLLYHHPAYLICTDPNLAPAQILQAYLWRWEIEVSFRDQKTLLGTGQAQVRTAAAVERVPVMIAAAYAYLHLALVISTGGQNAPTTLPRTHWQKPLPNQRCSTQQALQLLRTQLWGQALGVDNFSHFVRKQQALTKSEQFTPDPANTLSYATA